MNITAFHVNCTAPYLLSNRGEVYSIEYFDLLSTILSALQWKRLGGEIAMVTDPVGAEYYRKIGLESLWNGGIDDSLHLDIKGIDATSLWAAGKVFALGKMKAPCVMLDTDFIVWEDISSKLLDKPLVVAHREELYSDVYPPKEHFHMIEGYNFPEKWDWSALPCNTAFAYFGDEDLRSYYVKRSVEFMHSIDYCTDNLTNMVFAEQRLLAMCAAEKDKQISALLDKDEIFTPQKAFTHIWGFKQYMRENDRARSDFCERCEKRILKDFPGDAYLLDTIKSSSLVTI